MPVSAHPSKPSTKVRLEQHTFDDQVKYGLGRAGGWLYDRMNVAGVDRATFIDTFRGVVKEKEFPRFSHESSEASTPLCFDGSTSSTHALLDLVFETLDIPRHTLPSTCVIWIHATPSVRVFTLTAGVRDGAQCLYPRFRSKVVTTGPVRTIETASGLSRPKPFGWLRGLTSSLRSR